MQLPQTVCCMSRNAFPPGRRLKQAIHRYFRTIRPCHGRNGHSLLRARLGILPHSHRISNGALASGPRVMRPSLAHHSRQCTRLVTRMCFFRLS
jgi:hypothetical protein